MLYNVEKCKVVHFGYNNPDHEYVMGNVSLKSIESEKDLGVTIHSSLKPGVHIGNCVMKANQMLRMIRGAFKHRKKEDTSKTVQISCLPTRRVCSTSMVS